MARNPIRRRPRARESGPAPDQSSRSPGAGIVDCGRYAEDGRHAERVPVEQVGELARAGEGFVWIGMVEPSSQELGTLAGQLALPPLAVEDALTAHQRPKLEVYDDVVFAVLKPAEFIEDDDTVRIIQIAVFLGPHFVLTVRNGDAGILARVRSELDAGRGRPEFGPTGVLYRAADLSVDGYERAIWRITAEVDEIEEQVFGTGDDDHAERIYRLKREVAEFRRAVLPLRRGLERLSTPEQTPLCVGAAVHFRDVHDHLLRTADGIETLDRLLSDVLQANLARVSVRQSDISLRQNEDMRKISAWAAIALVPTGTAGIYGMNFEHMPELGWRYGYPAVLLVIVTICVLLYRTFRRNGWL